MAWSYGAGLRERWHLEPDVSYLNHGTVGATPRAVLAEQRRIQEEIERQPARFLLRDLAPSSLPSGVRQLPHMREAAAAVAPRLGARGEDVVFVDNATSGLFAVLASLPHEPGDGLLVADLGYGGVNNGARYLARTRGLDLQEFRLPIADPRPETIVAGVEAAIAPHTRVLVFDHIHSGTGLVHPVAAIAELCRARDITLVVDAAHVPGCLIVDVPALGADAWVGNLHKWAWAPRSSAVLWASPALQPLLHPPVISWGLDQGYAAEFDLVGTRDPSPHLAAPFALALLEEAGGEAVLAHNRALARAGAEHIAAAVDGELLGEPAQWATMVPVRLPGRLVPDAEAARLLKDHLLFAERIEAQITWSPHGAILRVAAQIYNELAEYERLARLLVASAPSR